MPKVSISTPVSSASRRSSPNACRRHHRVRSCRIDRPDTDREDRPGPAQRRRFELVAPVAAEQAQQPRWATPSATTLTVGQTG